jgi:cell filamentation protein, protein adenylyltransferase
MDRLTVVNKDRNINYAQARNKMMEHVGKPLTHDFIKSVHALVEPGGEYGYRVGCGAPAIISPLTKKPIYLPPLSGFIQEKMEALLSWYADLSFIFSPIEIAARLHWGFVKIHPFDDGNGRTARLLISYILLGQGYTETVCRALENHFESNKQAYYEALDDGIIVYESFTNISLQWYDYMRKSLCNGSHTEKV